MWQIGIISVLSEEQYVFYCTVDMITHLAS